ncbi:hypothetical protein [Cecembia sp.]|uniref:hypothetical protein n=1 Tax=Cecembia sp. TaxID=1898110 RepID=UPI0025B880EE|nr:hypothetical protein [Cecembia sp.]
MKRLLAIVMTLAFSCSEKEETLNSKLLGAWEAAYFAEDLGFESVNRYIFLSDGSYFYEWGYRVLGETEMTGYHNIWTGIYLTAGDQLSLQTLRVFSPPNMVTQPPFVPKDQLEEKSVSPSETNRFQFQISYDRSTLTVRHSQMDMDGATFQRVDE